jgi:uncharacterized protein (TIGR02266 family)
MGPEKRRDARYTVRVPIKLTRGKETIALQTENVSFRGAFLRMDAPPALRQLVRVQATLPEGASIAAHAMVVYRVVPGGDHVPGVGIQFYGLEGRERTHWEAFVRKIREELAPTSKPSPSPPPPPPPEGSPDPVQRMHERHEVRFEVHLDSVDDLVRLYTRDISKGGMAIETDMDLAVGTTVGLDLIHPDGESSFALDAVVRRQIRQVGARGIGVEFIGMDDLRREELADFIGPALPQGVVVTVKEGDPRLL